MLEGDRCRLVVIGVETGRRFSPEVVKFVDALAATSVATFSTLGLATSVDPDVGNRSFAASLVVGPIDVWSGTDGCVPGLADFLDR